MVIIGVIASMTIPTLINKTNKQEYVSKLKKLYSTFSQATNTMIAENGTPDNWKLKGSLSYNEASEKIGKLYQKYLSNSKQCSNGQTGCFGGSIYKDLSGNYVGSHLGDASSYYKLLLADGSTVLFDGNIYDACNIDASGTCAYFFVDVNGAKGPNVTGRDTFAFLITKNGLRPGGYNEEGRSPTVQCNFSSQDCTWKVLLENAMNY